APARASLHLARVHRVDPRPDARVGDNDEAPRTNDRTRRRDRRAILRSRTRAPRRRRDDGTTGMGDNSEIESTDATWNPVTDCTKISPGCKHGYAERLALRLRAMGNQRYRRGFDVTLHRDQLDMPLRWRRARRIFVNSMSDLSPSPTTSSRRPSRSCAAPTGTSSRCSPRGPSGSRPLLPVYPGPRKSGSGSRSET